MQLDEGNKQRSCKILRLEVLEFAQKFAKEEGFAIVVFYFTKYLQNDLNWWFISIVRM